MDVATDVLVVVHGHCYNFVMLYAQDLLWKQQSKLLMVCVKYVYVMPEELIAGVTLHFLKLYK